MSYKSLTFGTAGIRGIMGDNEGEINLESIAAISHSLAVVLKNKYKCGKVVFCYDSRHNGKLFADCAANIIGSYGFSVFVAEEPQPTPFLSFAVKEIHAVAGVNITASHNPKEYTGYKCYAEDGAQIDVPFAESVQKELSTMELPKEAPKAELQVIPQAIYQSYIDTIIGNNNLMNTDFGEYKGLFTPLFGSSGKLMRELAEKSHLPLSYVDAQMAPNGDFPNLSKPNPDDESVFAIALKYSGYPLILANDPDGDRLGAMVKNKGKYQLLSGNEIGVLLLSYLLATTDKLEGKFIVKSLVSTTFAETIAKAHNVAVKNVLVGFRYIAQKIAEDEANFLFGFEESGGYLAHSHAGDKDGIEATCLLLKAGAYYAKQGKTLIDVLDDLKKQYSEVKDLTLTVDLPIADSSALMQSLRENPPKNFGDEAIVFFDDYMKHNDEIRGNLVLFKTNATQIILRPSGTEPKMKIYCTLSPNSGDVALKINELFKERV